MATVYKRRESKPIPKGAEITTYRGKPYAKWTDSKTGKAQRAPLNDAGDKTISEAQFYTIQYFDHEGKRRKVSTRYADKDACPRDVVDEVILSEDKTGLPNLPARNGSYSRPKCLLQMNRNHEDSGISSAEGGSLEKTGVPDREMGSYRNNKHIMYCRRCELSCPVGA